MASSKRRPPKRPASRGGNPARRTPAGRSGSPSGGGRQPSRVTAESGFRESVSRTSAPLLVYLSRLPKWIVPAAMIVLVILGLAAPPDIGAVAFVLLAIFVSWLAFLSWPVLSGGARLLRVFVIAILLLAVVARLSGAL